MSYVSKYLRQAGVQTPYDNRTSAQIDEANKENPLSGYGFMSAAQKQQRELSMRLYEQQQAREQEMLQQQLIARMSSQEKIGHYAGAGLMGLMSHLKSKGQAPEVPNAPQDDPELARFRELSSEVGMETALEMLGNETKNPQMIEQARQMRMSKQKEGLEMQELSQKVNDPNRNFEHKPGYSEEVDTMLDGKPASFRRTLLQNTAEGGIWKETRPALKGGVSGTPEDFATSKGGINERTKSMEGALVSTANALDAYDRLEKLVQETPAGGWAGALTGKAEDIVSGLSNLSEHFLGQAETENWKGNADGSFASRAVGSYNWNKLEQFAGANAKIKSLVLELAYARAAATGDSSRSLSDRDVQNQLDQIGGQISNPKIFLDLVKQNKEMMVGKLENLGKYTRIDGKPILDAYKNDIDSLRRRVGIATLQTDQLSEAIQAQYGSLEAAQKRYEELQKKHGRK